MPTARSSTWTNPSPTSASARYGSLPACASASCSPTRGVVARAVDLARQDGDDRRAGARALQDDLVRPELRLVVPAHEAVADVPAVRLVDDLALRVAEDPDGRDVDDPGRLRGLGGVEEARRRPDVRVPHRAALLARDADPIAARRVDRRVDVAHRLGDRVDVREVVLEHGHAHVEELLGAPPVANRRDDLVAAHPQQPRDGLADEPGRAGEPDPPRPESG